MQTSHQIDVLSDGIRAISANGPHQVGAKNSERTGYDHEHVHLRPGLASDQKGTQVFHDLHDLNAFLWEQHLL